MNLNKYENADLNILTKRQAEILVMALQKMPRKDIAALCNCSVSNVSEIIRKACKKLDSSTMESKIIKKENKKDDKAYKSSGIDYFKYMGTDISALSPREREMFLLKLSGLRNKEIATRLKITQSAVSVTLCKVRDKLDGKDSYSKMYYKNHRDKFLDYQKEHCEITANARRKSYIKNREKRLEEMRKYNKEYYQKHKKDILEKRMKNE